MVRQQPVDGVIDSFTVRLPVKSEDGQNKVVGERIIKAWPAKQGKGGRLEFVPLWKWCKDEETLTLRIGQATDVIYDSITDDKAVMLDDTEIPYKKANFVDLQAESRHYEIAADLVPKGIKVGDRVNLTLMGCCSIILIEKVKAKKEKGKEKDKTKKATKEKQ